MNLILNDQNINLIIRTIIIIKLFFIIANVFLNITIFINPYYCNLPSLTLISFV